MPDVIENVKKKTFQTSQSSVNVTKNLVFDMTGFSLAFELSVSHANVTEFL